MFCKSDELKRYFKAGVRVHLVGIGGVSMRPLGLVLKGMGLQVTGSDMNASVSTDELISSGIQVFIGHSADNIQNADCVIRTAAAHNDNPEIAAARSRGIPVFERAQAWGVIMQEYRNAVCISGTHGKTTTTSMVTHILMAAEVDPTVMIGGYLPLLRGGHRVGDGDTIVLESCEYCDSFLNFFPTLAVILNVEADHLDYFKDLADVQKSFRAFAELSTGGILANGDDAHTREALEGLDYVSFGLNKENRVHGENIHPDWRHLDVFCDGQFYCHIDLKVLGRHNAVNALAAAGTAWMLGIPGEAVRKGLATFSGAERRMQLKGQFNGADIYDDYAHHLMSWLLPSMRLPQWVTTVSFLLSSPIHTPVPRHCSKTLSVSSSGWMWLFWQRSTLPVSAMCWEFPPGIWRSRFREAYIVKRFPRLPATLAALPVREM